MNFIEQLEQETRESTIRRTQAERARAREEEKVGRVVRPTMRFMHHYFTALAARLDESRPVVRADYEIRGIGTVPGFEQTEYRVVVPGNDPQAGFSFEFTCVAPSIDDFVRVDVDAGGVAPTRGQDIPGVRFRSVVDANAPSARRIEAYVPVSIAFDPLPEENAVRITPRNLEFVGTSRHVVDVLGVDEALLDELAKSVARRPNHFRQLTGNEITTDVRARMQAAIASRKRERALELRRRRPERGLAWFLRRLGLGVLLGPARRASRRVGAATATAPSYSTG